MGYMNSVTAGGFTVFPSLGLFVQPSKGDALFWLTERNDAVIGVGYLNIREGVNNVPELPFVFLVKKVAQFKF
jgi:hypothetical protein